MKSEKYIIQIYYPHTENIVFSTGDKNAVLRIRDVYPGSWFLPIPDPGSRIQKQQQKRGVKKVCCHNFLCSHKFHKIAHYFSFDVLKKKIWANFQRIIELFTQKIVNKLSNGSGFVIKIYGTDPRIRIRKKYLWYLIHTVSSPLTKSKIWTGTVPVLPN